MRAEASRPSLYPHFWCEVQMNLGRIRVAEQLFSYNTNALSICGMLRRHDTIRRLRTDRRAMLSAANGNSLITPAGQTAQPFNARVEGFRRRPSCQDVWRKTPAAVGKPFAPSHAIRDSRSGSPMQSVEPNTLQRVVVSANGRHEQALFWLFTSSTIRAWRRGSQGCASNQ